MNYLIYIIFLLFIISCQENVDLSSLDEENRLFYQDTTDLEKFFSEDPKKENITQTAADSEKNTHSSTKNSQNQMIDFPRSLPTQNHADRLHDESPSNNANQNPEIPTLDENPPNDGLTQSSDGTPTLEELLAAEDLEKNPDSSDNQDKVNPVDNPTEDETSLGDPLSMEDPNPADETSSFIERLFALNLNNETPDDSQNNSYSQEEQEDESFQNPEASQQSILAKKIEEGTINFILSKESFYTSKSYQGSPGGLETKNFKTVLCKAKNNQNDKNFIILIASYRVREEGPSKVGEHPLCEVLKITKDSSSQPVTTETPLSYAHWQASHCDQKAEQEIKKAKGHQCLEVLNTNLSLKNLLF